MLYQLGSVEIYTRYINRYRMYLPAFIQPFPQITAALLPNEFVHFINKAIIFKYRNKISWRNKAIFQANPAHQSLSTYNGAFFYVIFWLEIQGELLILNSPFHSIDDFLLLQHLLTHFFIIFTIWIFEIALGFPESHIGTVTHYTYRQGFIINAIKAKAENGAIVNSKTVCHHLQCINHATRITLARLITDNKIICI